MAQNPTFDPFLSDYQKAISSQKPTGNYEIDLSNFSTTSPNLNSSTSHKSSVNDMSNFNVNGNSTTTTNNNNNSSPPTLPPMPQMPSFFSFQPSQEWSAFQPPPTNFFPVQFSSQPPPSFSFPGPQQTAKFEDPFLKDPQPVAKPMAQLPKVPTSFQAPVSNSSSSIPTSVTPTVVPSQSEEKELAQTEMKHCFAALEKGEFSSSLTFVENALKILNSSSSFKKFQKEIKICVNYKLLLQLLLEIKQSENNLQKSALLTRILPEISVQAKHQVICTRKAIKTNFEAQNYGITARLIKTLLPLKLRDQQSLEEKLAQCQQFNEVDNSPFMLDCPSCKTSTNFGNLQCSACKTKLQFDFKTFQPLTLPEFVECTFCEAIFAKNTVNVKERCPLCFISSTLVEGSIPTVQVTKKSLPLPPKSNTSLSSNSISSSSTSGDPFAKFMGSTFLPSSKSIETPLVISSISETERTNYKNDFQNADLDHNGFVDGNEAKQYFSKFGLLNKILAQIWKLSDCDEDGKLNLEEFIIAMHLIQCALSGMNIPENLPPELKANFNKPSNAVSSFSNNTPLPPKSVPSFPSSNDTSLSKSIPTPPPKSIPSFPSSNDTSLSKSIPTPKSIPSLPTSNNTSLPTPLTKSLPTPPAKPIPSLPSSNNTSLPKSTSSVPSNNISSSNPPALPSKQIAVENKEKHVNPPSSSAFGSSEDLSSLSNPSSSFASFPPLNLTSSNASAPSLPTKERNLGPLPPLPQKSTALPINNPPPVPPKEIRPIPPAPSIPSASINAPSISVPPPLPSKTEINVPHITTIPPPLPPSNPSSLPPSNSIPLPPPLSIKSTTQSPVSVPPPVPSRDKSISIETNPPSQERPKKEKKDKDRKVFTWRGSISKKKSIDETEHQESTTSAPPSLFIPPPIETQKEEPVEPVKPPPIPLAPPPSLVTPPMLSNKIETNDTRSRIRGHSVPSSTQIMNDPSLQNLPPPISLPSPLSIPPPIAINTEEGKKEENLKKVLATDTARPSFSGTPIQDVRTYDVVQNGLSIPPKDYLSEVPTEVAISVKFLQHLLQLDNLNESYSYFADTLKAQVSIDQLSDLGKYYSNLGGLWYCQAFMRTQSQAVVILIPLYFKDDVYHQAKVWLIENKIAGLEFSALDEEKFKNEGQYDIHIISNPKKVIRKDGRIKEIHSPQEELAAILDPNVPLGIQTAPFKKIKATLNNRLEFKDKKPSLSRKSKDGKKYYVWAEISNIVEMKKANPEAFCKEYWIPHDQHFPFCYLLEENGEKVSDELYVELSEGELELYSSYCKKKKKDRAPVAKKNIPSIEHFYIAVPVPPKTASQEMELETIEASPSGFLSPDNQAYIITYLPGKSSRFSVEVTWNLNLRPNILKPKYEGECFIQESISITEQERKLALKPTTDVDFKDLSFEDFLARNSLVKGIFDLNESVVTFVERVYIFVVTKFEFQSVTEDFKASQIMRARRGDALGLCRLFVGVLRHSGIPSRVLYGRVSDSNLPYAMAQFYLDDTGWVPIDIASQVQGQNSRWDPNKSETLMGGFGKMVNSFVIWSLDNHLIHTPAFGPRLLNTSDFTISFEHKKLNTDWRVVPITK